MILLNPASTEQIVENAAELAFLLFFGFFALVLVAIFWINRAVRLFDRLIGDGQSALVVLEFSMLTVPNVIRLVLPISAFAAAVSLFLSPSKRLFLASSHWE